MNAQAVAEINNTMAALMNYIALGCLEEHMDELFAYGEECSLYIPLCQIHARGTEAFKQAAEELYRREKWNIHMLHTAAYDGETKIMGNWNTYSYKISEWGDGNKASKISYQFNRITAEFSQDKEGCWKIKKMYILPLMTLAPWNCAHPIYPGLTQGGEVPFPSFSKDHITAEDFVKIRNLAGMFMHYAPAHAMKYFSKEEKMHVKMFFMENKQKEGYSEISEFFNSWHEKDRALGWLTNKITLTNPVIHYQNDRNHAYLYGLSHVFQSQVLDPKQPVYQAIRSIAQTEMTFVREHEKWCIVTVKMEPLLSLDPEINEDPRNLECMPSRVPEYFPDMDPEDPGLTPEDVFEIESILPQWTERLKRGDLESFPDLYMVNDKKEIRLSMRQVYEGYDAVMARCYELIHGQIIGKEDMLRFPQFHSGCTPVIFSDGQYAQGIWDDICWGNIGAAIFYEDDQKQREYLPGVGEYTHDFVKCADGWKIYSLADRSQKVAPMVDWIYNIDAVGGWSAAQCPKQWPLPFDCEQ